MEKHYKNYIKLLSNLQQAQSNFALQIKQLLEKDYTKHDKVRHKRSRPIVYELSSHDS